MLSMVPMISVMRVAVVLRGPMLSTVEDIIWLAFSAFLDRPCVILLTEAALSELRVTVSLTSRMLAEASSRLAAWDWVRSERDLASSTN